VAPGTTVTWTDNTTVGHNVVRCDSGCPANVGPGTGSLAGTTPVLMSPTINPGQTFSVTFNSPGTYNYYCSIHGYALMHGTITVT
jgi:plastocyanin